MTIVVKSDGRMGPMLPSQLPDVEGLFVACDTEGSGLHVDDGARVSVVSAAWEADGEVVTFAWPFDQGVRDKVPQTELTFADDPNLPEAEWRSLLEWLSRQWLIFHNAKHDLHQLWAGTRHWAGRDLADRLWWDTLLVSKVLDPTEPMNLGAVARRAGLGEGKQETGGVLQAHLKARKFKKERYDLADWDVIEPYAQGDAADTFRIWQLQAERSDIGNGPRNLQQLIRVELELCRTLYRMERRGISYDAATSLRSAEAIERRLERLEAQLPFRPTRPAANHYFFKERGIIPYKTTEKGAPQLDDEVLAKLIADGVAHAAEWDEVSELQRAVSMWYRGYPALIGSDGRLRTSFKQAFVKSGRMSVERLQLQAIPKEDKALRGVPSIRSMVQAAPGYELWNLDLSQAELRVAAHYCKCRAMLEMLADGADIHGITTGEIFGITPEHPDWKYKRDIAKRLTFGGIFQIGGKKFQATLSKLAGIHWALQDCDNAVQRWRSLYPEFGRAYRRADHIAQTRKWVRILPGTQWEHRSYFGPRDYSNSAWNRIVQGSLAYFNKLWMISTDARWPGLLVLNVHDSQLLEIPVASGPEVLAGAIGDHGAALATKTFGIAMRTDINRWEYGVDKAVKDDDQYAGVSGSRSRR